MKDTFNSQVIRVVLIVSCAFALAGCIESRGSADSVRPAAAAVERTTDPDGTGDPAQADRLEEQWGVKVERAALSAGGYMVDFRYRVLDPAKAEPILDRSVRPYVIDQATGARFIVPIPPKVGQLRSGGKIRNGAVYYIFFANPAQYIKKGNKITVVVGDFQVRDVVVQ